MAERRAKPAPLDLFCTCAPGLEPLLVAEIRALGLVCEEQPGGAALRGTPRDVARLNLWLRTASRVLVRLGAFPAKSFPELLHQASALPFERVLGSGSEGARPLAVGAVALRASCKKSRLYHSGAVIERVHAAIEARLGRKVPLARTAEDDDAPAAGEADASATALPKEAVISDTPASSPQLLLIRLESDLCTISADTSGALLHRRGYRTQLSQAPLRETLAAALLLAAGYTGGPLLDPCCGGGTIPIEAALIAMNRAPGLGRKFAVERWPGFAQNWLGELRSEARRKERPLAAGAIQGSDIDPRAISAAKANARSAGLGELLAFTQRVVESYRPDELPPATWLVSNPPYGKRTGAPGAELVALWAALGALGRDRRAALLCPTDALAKAAGAHLAAVVRTQNGGLPVSLLVSPRGST